MNKLTSMTYLIFITFLAPIIDGQNLWLEPQIFEFGKPMSLNCNVTEKTKVVAWWIVEEDGSPKKISNELVLNFASANHGHSAIYECFHMFENNGFLKYSREALVVESHCSKIMSNDTMNVQNLESTIDCRLKHANFLNFDDCGRVECDGAPIKSNKATYVVNKMKLISVIYDLNRSVRNCSYVCKNSMIPIFLNDFMEPHQMQLLLTTMKAPIRTSHQREKETSTNVVPIAATMSLFSIISTISTMGLAIVLMAITFVACYCKIKRRSKSTTVATLRKEGDVTTEVSNYEKLHHAGVNESQDQLQDAYSLPIGTTYYDINLYEEIKESYYLNPI